MALIAYASNELLQGEQTQVTLLTTEVAAVVADPYFQDRNNWKRVYAVIRSTNQIYAVSYGEGFLGDPIQYLRTSETVRPDDFTLVSIVIRDFDGGSYTYILDEAEQDAHELEVMPLGPSDYFEATWNITATSNVEFTIGATDAFYIDWGDGAGEVLVEGSNSTSVSHTYTEAGLYTSLIDTTQNGAHKYEHLTIAAGKINLIAVPSLGNCGWTSLNRSFLSCINLTAIAGGDTSNVTDMEYMFYANYDLVDLDLSSFNTAKVTNMSNMFYNVNTLASTDLSNFNTSSVTHMLSTFRGMGTLDSLSLRGWDFSSVIEYGTMFSGFNGNLVVECSDAPTATWLETNTELTSANTNVS